MDKSFKQMPFKRSIAQLLTDRRMATNILAKLAKFGISLDKVFSKQFQPLTSLNMLNDRYLMSYYYSSVTDITRLYLTIYNHIRFAWFIVHDKIYAVKFRFDAELYEQDTLFEGYVVGDYFYINDIVLYQGKIVDVYISDRLKLMNHIIDHQHQSDMVLDTLLLMVNDYVRFEHMLSFLAESNTPAESVEQRGCTRFHPVVCRAGAKPRNDTPVGVVFTPVNSDIIHYYSELEQFVKLSVLTTPNPTEKNATIAEQKSTGINKAITKCFKLVVSEKPDIYELFLQNDQYVGLASVPDKETSVRITGYLNGQKHCIVRCRYDNTFDRWLPYMKSSRNTADIL